MLCYAVSYWTEEAQRSEFIFGDRHDGPKSRGSKTPSRLMSPLARVLGKVLCAFVTALVLTWTTVAAQPYSGPIVDAHGHLGASFDFETIVSVMDLNGVAKQIVMARYYPGPAGLRDLPGSDKLAIKLAETYPGRFFSLVGMQRPLLSDPAKWNEITTDVERLLKEAEHKLASGRFFGIGEIIVVHWAYSRGPHAELDNPPYSDFMRRLSRLAERFDVPMVVHMEAVPEKVAEFERLITEHRKVRYVWAHNCGRGRAAPIRLLLNRHPNLYCDLGGMTNLPGMNYGTGLPRMEEFTSLIEKDGVLLPDMKALFEDYSDRFTLGMDVAHAPGMNALNYSRRVSRFRELVGQFKPEAQARLAHENAARIFKLPK